jgi:hypothetical protein
MYLLRCSENFCNKSQGNRIVNIVAREIGGFKL